MLKKVTSSVVDDQECLLATKQPKFLSDSENLVFGFGETIE